MADWRIDRIKDALLLAREYYLSADYGLEEVEQQLGLTDPGASITVDPGKSLRALELRLARVEETLAKTST